MVEIKKVREKRICDNCIHCVKYKYFYRAYHSENNREIDETACTLGIDINKYPVVECSDYNNEEIGD